MTETNAVVDLGVLERIRALEADIERCIDSVAQQELFRDEVHNARHRLLLDHFALEQADKVRHLAEKLLDAYLDEDDIVHVRNAPTLRRDDKDNKNDNNNNDNNNDDDDSRTARHAAAVLAGAMRAFEARVADIREYHHTYRDVPPIRETLAQPDAATLSRVFAPREREGACLDLEPHYQRYSAFVIATGTLAADCAAGRCRDDAGGDGSGRRLSALWAAHATAWEGRLDQFAFVPALPRLLLDQTDACRKLAGFDVYASFVHALLAYLCDYYARVRPLRAHHELSRLRADTAGAVDAYWTALQQEACALAKLNTDRYDDVMAAAAAATSTAAAANDGSTSALTTLTAADDAVATVTSSSAASAAAAAAKVSCGLRVPPSLRRYVKTFTVWPVQFIQDVLLPLRHAHDSRDGNDATDAQKAPATTTTTRTRLAAAARANNNNTNNNSNSSRAATAHLPRSLDEVKAVCVAEAQVVALLESLLFDALQQTEQTLLREYGKTADELEADHAREARAFAASLDAVRKLTAATMEGTVAHAAAYDVQAALHSSNNNNDGSSGTADVASGGSAASMTGSHYGSHTQNDGNTSTSAARLLARSEAFVGEDGKPIARWLVKLQQLDKSFVCEVCGGTVYTGPKMFREHFAAERHTEGLRRLGVTQHLKDFEGIAAIRTVIELRDRLLAGHSDFRKRLRDDLDSEEMQDGQGKVITTRDYRRFQRQRV